MNEGTVTLICGIINCVADFATTVTPIPLILGVSAHLLRISSVLTPSAPHAAPSTLRCRLTLRYGYYRHCRRHRSHLVHLQVPGHDVRQYVVRLPSLDRRCRRDRSWCHLCISSSLEASPFEDSLQSLWNFLWWHLVEEEIYRLSVQLEELQDVSYNR